MEHHIVFTVRVKFAAMSVSYLDGICVVEIILLYLFSSHCLVSFLLVLTIYFLERAAVIIRACVAGIVSRARRLLFDVGEERKDCWLLVVKRDGEERSSGDCCLGIL